jgi:hypothetical protein
MLDDVRLAVHSQCPLEFTAVWRHRPFPDETWKISRIHLERSWRQSWHWLQRFTGKFKGA